MSTIQKAKEAAHQLGGISAISVEANERIIELLQDNKVPEAVKEKWIYANGIHCIDLMRFFADADSKEVTSVSLPSQKKYNALIKFMSGITAHYFSHPDIPSKWTVILYAHQAKITLRPLELCTIEKRGEPPQEFGLDDLDRKYKPGFFQQNRHFIDCVKSKAPILWPACDIEQAVEVMRLIEKIEK